MKLLSSIFLSLALAAGSAHAGGYAPIKRMLKPGARDPGPAAIVNIAGSPHMSGPEYTDLKAASLTLLRKFSPASHYFVFLGRDAAPISAFVQNLGGKQLAVNFPASSNEAGRDTPQVMKEYVDRIIPEEVLNGGRTIVVVDATSTGRALDYWIPKIQPHLRGVPVQKAAFANPTWQIHRAPGDKHVFSTAPFPIVDQYFTGQYENGISEFPRHAPGAHPVSDIAQSRPEWIEFRKAIAQRMEADEELDRALSEIGGVEESTPEARRERKAAMVAERKRAAADIRELRRTPSALKKEVDELVSNLGERTESHDKGPYLGENAEKLNTWLVDAIQRHKKVEAVSQRARDSGANELTLHFITKVLDKAVGEKKIRKRDYRRLLGHALGFTPMDGPALAALSKHYKHSADMQRELTDESEYYLEGSRHQPAGTENMSTNYSALMRTLGAGR